MNQSYTHKPKVDFIGIGVNKSATSWIVQCLREHPQVSCSQPKETHFFSNNFSRGIKWYSSCFRSKKEGDIIGEYSPDYLQNPDSPKRIKEFYPNAKLIVCLRNPVDRVISAFYFNKGRGKHSFDTVREKIEKEPGNDINKSLYYRGLKTFFTYFPKKQFIIILFDDVKKNPVPTIQKIYRFLDVDDTFTPASAEKKVNQTVKNAARILFINAFLQTARRTVKASRWKTPLISWGKSLKLDTLSNFITRLNANPKHKLIVHEKKVSNEDRDYLHNFFREDIQKTSELLGTDLSMWDKKT